MLTYLRIPGTFEYWDILDKNLSAAMSGAEDRAAGARRHRGGLGAGHRPDRPRQAAQATTRRRSATKAERRAATGPARACRAGPAAAELPRRCAGPAGSASSSCCRRSSGCWPSPIFPLGYSLYLALLQDRAARSRSRPREGAGARRRTASRCCKRDGKPRTKNVVNRRAQTTFDLRSASSTSPALFGDPQVHDAIRVTAIFVLVAVPIELVLGLAAGAAVQPAASSAAPVLRTIMILPIFATPLAVGYLFFTIFYEVGGPLGFLGIPFLSDPELGAVLGDPGRRLAVDAVLLPGVPRRAAGRAGRAARGGAHRRRNSQLATCWRHVHPAAAAADDHHRAAAAPGRGAEAVRHPVRD